MVINLLVSATPQCVDIGRVRTAVANGSRSGDKP